jgi:hypothetical protein
MVFKTIMKMVFETVHEMVFKPYKKKKIVEAIKGGH